MEKGNLKEGKNIMGKKDILKKFGAKEENIEELLKYNEAHFNFDKLKVPVELPHADALFVANWRQSLERSKDIGIFEALKENLVQLCFPIKEGISKEEEYQDVSLSGEEPSTTSLSTGLVLNHPELLHLELYPTAAGHIPVLSITDRGDFESIFRALACKNEPVPIPKTTGACAIRGYNNWGRMRSIKDWEERFDEIIEQKELYQDQFILLSRGYYSAVSPEQLPEKETEKEWLDHSYTIRLEHEVGHYTTKVFLDNAQNHVLDELICDYAGVVAAYGEYKPELFNVFFGMEKFPEYRKGSRMDNYLGDPPLSEESFIIQRKLVYEAAQKVYRFDQKHGKRLRSEGKGALCLLAIAKQTLIELASEDGEKKLDEALLYLQGGS
jgi:hypothetical protein